MEGDFISVQERLFYFEGDFILVMERLGFEVYFISVQERLFFDQSYIHSGRVSAWSEILFSPGETLF